MKIVPAKQKMYSRYKTQFDNYKYDKSFDFRKTNADLKVHGSFQCGVFDIKTPNLLDYFITSVNSWYGLTLTLTPYKSDTSGKYNNDEAGASKDYSIQLFSPLVIDYYSRGRVEATKFSDHVFFDIDNDGVKERTAWIDAKDGGFLALDLNGDHKINSGSELFGEASVLKNGKRASNGFEALKQYDSNKDGFIDNSDKVFEKLVVWGDENFNGISEASELKSLTDIGLIKIDLKYGKIIKSEQDSNESKVLYKSEYFSKSGTCEDGCKVYDFYLFNIK